MALPFSSPEPSIPPSQKSYFSFLQDNLTNRWRIITSAAALIHPSCLEESTEKGTTPFCNKSSSGRFPAPWDWALWLTLMKMYYFSCSGILERPFGSVRKRHTPWFLEQQHLKLSFLVEAVGTALGISSLGPWKRAASALAARLQYLTEWAWLIALSSSCHQHRAKQEGCWHASPLAAEWFNGAFLITQGFVFSSDTGRHYNRYHTYQCLCTFKLLFKPLYVRRLE